MSEIVCILFGIFIGYYMGNAKFRQWLKDKAKSKKPIDKPEAKP